MVGAAGPEIAALWVGASIILDARFVQDNADHAIDIEEAGKAKGHDDQNSPKNDVAYRMADIEGAVEAADRTTGTIQQLGFIQDCSIDIVGKYNQG